MIEICIVILWYVLSFIYFISIFGDKFRKDKWFDSLWVIPVFSIIYVILFIEKIIEFFWHTEK